jgi:hypothetical protein
VRAASEKESPVSSMIRTNRETTRPAGGVGQSDGHGYPSARWTIVGSSIAASDWREMRQAPRQRESIEFAGRVFQRALEAERALQLVPKS